LDKLQRFSLSGSNPVPLQLFSVKFHPLEQEAQGSSREGLLEKVPVRSLARRDECE
jgi:hypothetical protein